MGQLMVHNHITHRETAQAPGARFAPASVEGMDLDGGPGGLERLPLRGRNRAVMLLVLSTECQFCEQNMPNWRRLVDEVASLGADAPEIVALSVSPAADTRDYLQRHGVDVRTMLIEVEALRTLGLSGYPGTVTVVPETREMLPREGVLSETEQQQLLDWARDQQSSRVGGEIADAGDH